MISNGGVARHNRLFRYEIKDRHYLKTLVMSASLSIAIFLPAIISGHGIFLFHGDFNNQQIPFWQYCHQAVRSGDIFWSHVTDLGSPFIASYSFYVIGSPFFWLTLPFPTSFVPYLMGPLLIIKISTAAVLAYAYIKRFVENRDWAVIGSLLYAFSSFTIHNVVYNHFIDVIALFPLLLISMEELIVNERKGVFALSVALCAITNYFFFVGQVVFLVLYFVIRSFSSDFSMTFRKFLFLTVEALLGAALAAFMLLPSLLMLLGNSRATNLMTWGLRMVYHGNTEKYGHIAQSFFMMTDLPAFRKNFFPASTGFEWASVAAYMPLFGMAGVIAFLRDNKGHWLRRLIVICMVIICVPVLNSLFFAMNATFYARWLYMLILIMCLATAITLDRHRTASLKLGFWCCIGFVIVFTVVGVILENVDFRRRVFSENAEPLLVIVPIAVALTSSAIGLVLLYAFRKNHARYVKSLFIAVVFSVLLCFCFQLWSKTPLFANHDNYVANRNMAGKFSFPDPYEKLYRIDGAGGSNISLSWGQPTIGAHHSVLPPATKEFDSMVGAGKTIGTSRPDEYYGLRGLLSVKHFLNEASEELPYNMPGFEYARTVVNYDIYDNTYYIPPGFTFDYYIEKATFDGTNIDDRHLLLCKALVLDETQAKRYAGYITRHPQLDEIHADIEGLRTTAIDMFTADAYITDCINASSEAAESFVIDNTGFTAQISLSSPKLVFFSVPYDRGWTASINGEAVQVEKVNYGFMAVPASAGINEMRFDYDPPGLRIGLYIGLAAAVVLIIYAVVLPRIGRYSGIRS